MSFVKFIVLPVNETPLTMKRGPQILVTMASEEVIEEDCKSNTSTKWIDWIFILTTILLVWVSALTRTCLLKAIFIGVITTTAVIILFLLVYKMGEWRFDANKDIEESQVIFNFDRLLQKRNSVFSETSISPRL